MSVTLNLKGWGGLVILIGITITVGVLIFTSPGMVESWIDIIKERPLVSAGFGLLFVVLVLFGNGPPGDDGTA